MRNRRIMRNTARFGPDAARSTLLESEPARPIPFCTDPARGAAAHFSSPSAPGAGCRGRWRDAAPSPYRRFCRERLN